MKVPKHVSLKTLAVTVLIAVLASGFIFYVLAPTPTSTFWISPGAYPGAPSYTIWRDGSNYFAKDENGEIEFSGTNASDLVIDCVAQLSSGGRILFKASSTPYDFDSQVAVAYSIVFEGEGTTQTQIRLTTASIYLFSVTASDVVFRDIYFNGNGQSGGCGIRFGAGANFALVEFCRFYNFDDAAINVYGSGGTNILGRILHSTFWSCDYGVKLTADSGYWANDWVFMGNRFQTIATQALQIGTGNGVATGARIIANTIENSPTGIRLDNNSDYARITDNRFENCTSYGVYIINGPNNINVAFNYFSDANITVSSIGAVHYIAYNDGNLDYVSYQHYFYQDAAPTAPTPVNGSMWFDSDAYELFVWNGASWEQCSP